MIVIRVMEMVSDPFNRRAHFEIRPPSMEQPRATAAAHAALTSAELFPYIASFIPGVPVWAVEYEATHHQRETSNSTATSSLSTPGLLPRLAIQHNDLPALQRLHQLHLQPQFRRHSKFWFTSATRDAALTGNLEALQWLFANTNASYHTFNVILAAEKGHTDVVKWLIEHPRFVRTHMMDSAFESAAANGFVEVLRVFNTAGWALTIQTMDAAAANGHLDVIIFLHERRYGGTVAAADQAAANGHFHVVEWLLTHRSEGVSDAAMYSALVNGHVDIVRYLWTTRHGEGKRNYEEIHKDGAKKAILLLLTTEKVETVAVAYAIIPGAFPSHAMMTAASNGQFEMVKFLHSTGRPQDDVDQALVASAHHYPEIAQFLLANNSFSKEVLTKALEIPQWSIVVKIPTSRMESYTVKTETTEHSDSEILAVQISLRQKLDKLSLEENNARDANSFLPVMAFGETSASSTRQKAVRKPRSARTRPAQKIGGPAKD